MCDPLEVFSNSEPELHVPLLWFHKNSILISLISYTQQMLNTFSVIEFVILITAPQELLWKTNNALHCKQLII